MVVVPVDPYENKAQHITNENRKQGAQSMECRVMGRLHLQDHDGNNDCDHAVTKSFDSSFSHLSILIPNEVPFHLWDELGGLIPVWDKWLKKGVFTESFIGMQLLIREYQLEDFPAIQAYWLGQSVSDLERMHVDPVKLKESMAQPEKTVPDLKTPDKEKKAHRYMWLLDGELIGMTTLRNMTFGGSAEIHLHIFDSTHRNKGFGLQLFLISLREVHRRFELKNVFCEPAASNPAPNRLLQRLGFKIAKTYRTIPGYICFEHVVNRYEIDCSALPTLH